MADKSKKRIFLLYHYKRAREIYIPGKMLPYLSYRSSSVKVLS